MCFTLLYGSTFTDAMYSVGPFKYKVIELPSDIFRKDEDLWHTAMLNDSLRFISFEE